MQREISFRNTVPLPAARHVTVCDMSERRRPRPDKITIDHGVLTPRRDRRFLELTRRYGSDDAMGVRYVEEDGEGFSQLPNGRSVTLCTNCAEWIRAHEPDCRILGWPKHANPTATVMGDVLRGVIGHDFAVVGDRYIVDPWAIETARTTTQAVFDLDDPRDHALVRTLYGDPEAWEESGNIASEKGLPLTAALRLRLERAMAATA